MDFSPNLTLPYLLPNQAEKHVTLNESLRALDALVQIHVISRAQSSPPADPSEGDRYIPAAGASSEWTDFDGGVVAFQDGGWVHYPASPGWLAWIGDEATIAIYDGTTWASISQAPNDFSLLGINAVADTVNRLVLKSPASLFDHEGSDHRLKVNKNALADTASLLFQSNYDGHAEMGLMGNTNFAVKVSADGTNFLEAISVQSDDGFVGVGTATPVSRLHVQQTDDARLTIDTTAANNGGGFDIINSTDNQSWRVTGQKTIFKLRDHTAGLDKLELFSGASGRVRIRNCGNVGINVTSPTTALHVNGAVRIGSSAVSALTSAASAGEGAIIYVPDAIGGAILAFSDGSSWRRSDDRSVIS